MVTHWEGFGTHNGRVESVEPTGAARRWWGVSVSKLATGKIVAMWWASISGTIPEGTVSAMELDSLVESVSREETGPDEEVYRRKPRPLWCCIFRC